MKHKNLLLSTSLLLFLVIAAFGVGLICPALASDAAAGEPYHDRLVGMLITYDYLDLFDFESYLNDNLNDVLRDDDGIIDPAEGAAYEGRLYAAQTQCAYTEEETGEVFHSFDYTFDVEGFVFACADVRIDANESTHIDAGYEISDGNTAISVTDDGKQLTMSGTIYSIVGARDCVYYFNPIYQDKSGAIYAVSGHGMSVAGVVDAEGSVMSQTTSETVTNTINGKSETYSAEITISIATVFRPEEVTILQYATDGALLIRTQYAPDAMPELIVPQPETDYLIIETRKCSPSGEESTLRELFQRKDDSLKTLCPTQNGICITEYTPIEWPK